MSRRNSVVGTNLESDSKKGLGRRISMADISTVKKKFVDSRRKSVAAPTRRSSVATVDYTPARRASFAGISNAASRRTSVPNFSAELQGIVEGEHFVDASELFDLSPTSGKGSKKSRRRSEANVDGKNEKEKEVEPSAEEKKEAFRSFVNETLKTVFDLIMTDDKINVNIDNVFPLMKTLELDTKDEAILDMVRTSCIETFGDIDEKEFDDAIVDLRKRTVGEEFEDDLRSAFHLIDYDDDGFITTSDIYQLMMGLGEMLTDYELEDLLKVADVDGDAKINYKDFKLFLVGEWTEEDEIREKGVENVEEESKQESEEGKGVSEGKDGEEAAKEEGEPSSDTPAPSTEAEKADVEKKEDKEEKKDDVKLEQKDPKPPRRARNSLLWGYLSSSVDQQKNDQIANALQKTKQEAEKKSAEKDMETEGKSETDDAKKDKSAAENTIIESDENKKESVIQESQLMDKSDTDQAVESHDENENKDGDDVVIKDENQEQREEAENEEAAPDGAEDGAEDARSVISVTVKHLDSILEEGEDENDSVQHKSVSRPQSYRKPHMLRQSSFNSLKMRPSSGSTDVFGDDSGIDVIDTDDLKSEDMFENTDDEGIHSRADSARSQLKSGKSNSQIINELPSKDGISEEEVNEGGKRSISTQLNFYESDPVLKALVTKSRRLHLCTESNGAIGPYEGKKESSDIQENDYDHNDENWKDDQTNKEWKGKAIERKRLHVQNLSIDHLYCEVGIEEVDADKMDVGSVLDYSSITSSPRQGAYTRAIPTTGRKIPRLLRTTSADRFKTVKLLESEILRRQTTDPQLFGKSSRKMNTKDNKLKRNANGMQCTHIDLDLGLGEELDSCQNFRPYSPLRRPRTAMTFNEARRRAAVQLRQDDYQKYDSGIDSPDTDEDKGFSVVDLSKCLSAQFGGLEPPNQPLQHHGYKSVRPLARVMSAYNNKYNDGKSMKLNSISRRLERREIPVCWSERENPNIKFRQRPHTARQVRDEYPNERQEAVSGDTEETVHEIPCYTNTKTRQRPQTARPAKQSKIVTRPSTACYKTVKKSNIITLSLPFETDSKTRYKRVSPLSSYDLHRREIS